MVIKRSYLINLFVGVMLPCVSALGQLCDTDAGVFAFPNVNMLYPFPGQDITAITGLLFMQALNERWTLAAGKINSVDLENVQGVELRAKIAL